MCASHSVFALGSPSPMFSILFIPPSHRLLFLLLILCLHGVSSSESIEGTFRSRKLPSSPAPIPFPSRVGSLYASFVHILLLDRVSHLLESVTLLQSKLSPLCHLDLQVPLLSPRRLQYLISFLVLIALIFLLISKLLLDPLVEMDEYQRIDLALEVPPLPLLSPPLIQFISNYICIPLLFRLLYSI